MEVFIVDLITIGKHRLECLEKLFLVQFLHEVIRSDVVLLEFVQSAIQCPT